MTMPPQTSEPLSQDLLLELETTAVELAQLAGAEIEGALGRTLSVRYKGEEAGGLALRDPVSEVDHRVETVMRARLGELFPGHGVLGEEMDETPAEDSPLVWAVDPVDGTTNFVNGFPLFAASIGVLHKGRPVVGAIWCAATHALRPGVYHAREGGPLQFENETLQLKSNPAVRRRLAGDPEGGGGADFPWEPRRTGSAALECAFVAAGLLEVARFARPNVWDVAAGMALIAAADGEVYAPGDDGWAPFGGFGDRPARNWTSPLIVGEPAAVRRAAGRAEASAR